MLTLKGIDVTITIRLAVRDWDYFTPLALGDLKPEGFNLEIDRVGTLVDNLIWNGVGGFQIDGCRVPIAPAADASQLRTMQVGQHDGDTGWGWNTTAPATSCWKRSRTWRIACRASPSS